MKCNMGSLDRVLRAIVAVLLGALYLFNVVEGTFGIILLIVAGIFLLTSITGYCGLYTILNISTNRREKQNP